LIHLLPILRYRNDSLCARDASAIARIGVLEIMLNGEQHSARAAGKRCGCLNKSCVTRYAKPGKHWR
jgi:hypothetical protein